MCRFRVITDNQRMSDQEPHTVFICGSALRGQPDHGNLRGAEFLGETRTVAAYRIHSVKDGWHPGIYKVSSNGVAIPGELYRLSADRFDFLVSTEPPDMYPAEILLDDGATATAMLYPERLINKFAWPDISDMGGWIAFKEKKAPD
jgi:hypothetical protein